MLSWPTQKVPLIGIFNFRPTYPSLSSSGQRPDISSNPRFPSTDNIHWVEILISCEASESLEGQKGRR